LNANNIITLSLLVGLFVITPSFVLYKRKSLIMLRALFSSRYLQQLLREGKLTNENPYLYAILLYLFSFSCFLLTIFQFYPLTLFETYHLPPWLLYVIIFCILVFALFLSRFILYCFTSFFNYQEQKYLYTTIKTLFRFCNALVLLSITPVIWYAKVFELVYFLYLPIVTIIFLAFIILFLRNISGVSRIHFFIYFCSLEILPYLLIAKLLIINF